MADISIDTSNEAGEFTIVNAEMSFITISGMGVSWETSWDQAQSLYRALKEFFESEADQDAPA